MPRKGKQINFYIDTEIHKTIKKMCIDRHTTMQKWILRAIVAKLLTEQHRTE